jgi:hypothetical protein
MTLIPFADKSEHDAYCHVLRERGYQCPGGRPSLTLCPNCGEAMVCFTFSLARVISKLQFSHHRFTYGCPGCKTFFKEPKE